MYIHTYSHSMYIIHVYIATACICTQEHAHACLRTDARTHNSQGGNLVKLHVPRPIRGLTDPVTSLALEIGKIVGTA